MSADLGKYETIQPKARHVFECFKVIEKQKTHEEKINSFRVHMSQNLPFKQCVMWNSLKRISSMLPPGKPPFAENSEDGVSHRMWEYLNMFPYFVRSTKSENMKPLKIEQLFINVLEVLPTAESELLCKAKDGLLSEEHSWLTSEFLYEVDQTIFAEHKEVPVEKEAEPEVETVVEKETPVDLKPSADLEVSPEILEEKPKPKAKPKAKTPKKKPVRKQKTKKQKEVVESETPDTTK